MQQQQPYLTTKQVQELSANGFTIGSHSIDHPLFSEIELSEQLRQTIECLDFTNSLINQNIKLFAFPFSDNNVSKLFFEKIAPFSDLTFGTAGIKNDIIPNNIQRISNENKNSKKQLKYIVYKEYFEFLIKKLIGKDCIIRS